MGAQRTAIFSDIHGHSAGLRATLADADAAGCTRLLCLGDLVDGGEGNEAVARYLRDHQILTVRGNHDETNALELAEDVRAFLDALPQSLREDDILYTHISPREKQAKISDEYEAWNVFDETTARLVFFGHVHVPLIFGERCVHKCQATAYPVVPNTPFPLDPTDRYLICVGAVGYPRDGLRKPRYAIHDAAAGTIEIRTVPCHTLPLG